MRFLETIRLEEGHFDNLAFHQERMDRTRKDLLHSAQKIDLGNHLIKELAVRSKDIVHLPGHPASHAREKESKIFKCRVIYAEKILKIEFQPYILPTIRAIKLVYAGDIEYAYKFEDRTALNNLFAEKGENDDILIVKRNEITDTLYANVLFFDGSTWYTPRNPLLQGTRRESLVREGKAVPAILTPADLSRFRTARVVNAMIRFEDRLDIQISNINP